LSDLSSKLLKGTFVQFISFASIGAIGTLVHYAVLISLVQIGEIIPVVGSVIGFICGALVNYTLNYHITFRSNKQHHEAMLKFFSVAICGLVINTIIMSLSINSLHLHYILSQMLASGLVLIWNFSCNKIWTFREVKSATGGRETDES